MKRFVSLLWKSPIFWGAVSSILIVGAAFFVLNRPTCWVSFDELTHCSSKWRYLMKAPPNEFGDTLAGFAGALAFIWIIATVAMQSLELKAQREELNLTRQEFERMADAQSEQVALLIQQGKIFEQEQAERRMDYVDREVDALLTSISQQFERHIKNRFYWIKKKAPKDTPWHGDDTDSLCCYAGEESGVDDKLFSQTSEFLNSLDSIIAELTDHKYIEYPKRADAIIQLSEMCDRVSAVISGASPAMQSRVRSTNLRSIVVPLAQFVGREDVWEMS